MAVPTTRELNVKVIFMVTIVATLLLVAIVYAAQAGFFYFQNQQVQRQYDRASGQTFAETGSRGDNLDLARMQQRHREELHAQGTRELRDADGNVTGTVTLMPIDQAMQRVAERY